MVKKEKAIKIHLKDMVAVALVDLYEGDKIKLDNKEIEIKENISMGHKIALIPIPQNTNIIKYGHVIGKAKRDILTGEKVHIHNMETNLKGILNYSYKEKEEKENNTTKASTFMGYRRKNGSVGIRNDIWIINTTGCVNNTARMLERLANDKFKDKIDSIYATQHTYGCSQLGDDHLYTQKILADLVNHPNAGGVLILSLGCENNNINEFKKVLGKYDEERVKIMITQDEDDEIERGMELIEELVDYATQFKREPIPLGELVVGFKCGASDSFSGITANPLVGDFSDRLVSEGGTTILTEVPEMFGAETLLMDRANNKETFNKIVSLINNFKEYYIKYGEEISENPAPGNLEGGISTLEEKSLGCIQKGGTSTVVDVLKYGERVKTKGLNLLEAPGNDLVSITALASAGAHIILFTTGRGNPLGAPIPTIKISSNTKLFKNKPSWIDINAGSKLEGKSTEELSNELFDYVIKVASGEIATKNELKGYKDIGIFKDGVIL